MYSFCRGYKFVYPSIKVLFLTKIKSIYTNKTKLKKMRMLSFTI